MSRPDSPRAPARLVRRALSAAATVTKGPFGRGLNPFLRLMQWGTRPILIVGHGRSGTSWIGKTLGEAPGTLYVHEPCNPFRWPDGRFEHWFAYLSIGDGDSYVQRGLDAAFRGLLLPKVQWSGEQLRRRLTPGYRLVVKEVSALMAAEWVEARYRPTMIAVIRHPCAVTLSEYERDVDHERSLRQLMSQHQLMRDHLAPYRALLESARTPFEQFAAVWGARNRVLANYLASHPDWLVVNYEQLAAAPVAEFRRLYGTLGLTWSERIAEFVRRTTTTHDPGAYATRKIASEQLVRWRAVMSPEEVDQVRRFVLPFELPFFHAAEDFSLSGSLGVPPGDGRNVRS